MQDVLRELKKIYSLFNKNKAWILSGLFICSIVKSAIWYACFGINILSYSDIQDLLVSFAEYFMSIITLMLTLILCILFFSLTATNKRTGWIGGIVIFLFFIVASLFYLSLFRLIQPVLFSFFMIVLLINLFIEKDKTKHISLFLCLILLFTIVQPVEYFRQCKKDTKNRMSSTTFVEQNAHYDNFSFNYNGNVIDTSKDRFLYIGNNSSYFFIFDRDCNKSLIIPKSECSDITATPFEMRNILILGLLFS